MKAILFPLLALAASAGAMRAAEVRLTIEIPRLQVAEYHRPYVAAWLEKPDRSHAANLAVWYDTGMKNGEGEKWLKDMRQWWRKSGRSTKMPVDGVSSPTRPVGVHDLTVTDKFKDLAAGDYVLIVEASREVGGREMLRLPFKWDGKSPVKATAAGKTELGKVGLTVGESAPE